MKQRRSDRKNRRWTTSALLVSSLALLAIPAGAELTVVHFLGAGVPVDPADVPGSDLVPVPAGALCYKVPMLDPDSGFRIGTGFDCLSEIVANPVLSKITLTDTAYFRFPGGLFVSEGSVVIRSAGPGHGATTHITGGFPEFPNILAGRGQHAGIAGTVRVSGGVDMSAFPATIGFDCLFVIDTD